jgi:hypothetical protein
MAEKRRSADWDTTSSLIAKIHNVACLKRTDMISPTDIHPYAPKPPRIELSPKESGDLLVALLVPKP